MDTAEIVFAESARSVAPQPAGKLQIVSNAEHTSALSRLARSFQIDFVKLADLGTAVPQLYILCDIDYKDRDGLIELKKWLRGKPKFGKILVAIDKESRFHEIQALALGATDTVERPLYASVVARKLWGDFATLATGKLSDKFSKSPVIMASLATLRNIMMCTSHGEAIDLAAVNSSSAAIVTQIEEKGLTAWIDIVREHHSQTYQHSLIVTAVAVGFGRALGASETDLLRLSLAGMLHDIGKSVVPISILEKPGRLEDAEMEILRRHPRAGYDSLRHTPGIDPGILDLVLSHHEYLDGSGYPEGLGANRISDVVRLMTIADIFGALIERRAYKPPYAPKAAYDVLVDMGPKLDQDMVREFRAVAAAMPDYV